MRLTILNVPTGVGVTAAPTATGNTATISLFSISASRRSGMLTTMRRFIVGWAADVASAATARAAINAATRIIVVTVVCGPGLLMASSPVAKDLSNRRSAD